MCIYQVHAYKYAVRNLAGMVVKLIGQTAKERAWILMSSAAARVWFRHFFVRGINRTASVCVAR